MISILVYSTVKVNFPNCTEKQNNRKIIFSINCMVYSIKTLLIFVQMILNAIQWNNWSNCKKKQKFIVILKFPFPVE